jgi:hypothetical protein
MVSQLLVFQGLRGGRLIQPIRDAIKQLYPSRAQITPQPLCSEWHLLKRVNRKWTPITAN